MKQLNWYQIFGKSNIPDGRTVLPTDDIQIWLHCANIWDKTYTTLGEVLNDTDTLSALMASNNAVDYLVRSTSWATQISVPTMTGNTTPEGECFASSVNSDSAYYRAFDKNTSTHWYSLWNSNPTNGYIGYKFSQPVVCNSMHYTCESIASDHKPLGVIVQGSNDGVTYTDLASATWAKNNNPEDVFFASNTTAYEYYRMFISGGTTSNKQAGATELQFYSASITTSATAMTYIGQNNYCANTLLADVTWCNAICNSEYFESVLNVKVPKMTSATTPEGAVIESGHYTSNYGWQAFDGNTSTRWAAATQNVGEYCGYIFTTPNAVAKIQYLTASNVNYTAQLKGSNDGVTWTNVSDTFALGNSDNKSRVVYNGVQYDRYAVFAATSGIQSFMELQFYGRKDV